MTVTNAAPVVGDLVATSTSNLEGGTVTLTGTVSDPGSLDTHAVTVQWGDGTTSSATLTEAGGKGTFAATHVYVDNPIGAPAGPYTVTVTAKDDDGGSSDTIATAPVANAAPLIGALSVSKTEILEGGSVSLTGTLTDIGLADTHSVTIQWGDGLSSAAKVTESKGAGKFTATHVYADNPAGLDTGAFTIRAIVTDDDGG